MTPCWARRPSRCILDTSAAAPAAAYAPLERNSYGTQRITLNEDTAQEYAAWGEPAMPRWREELDARRRAQLGSEGERGARG